MQIVRWNGALGDFTYIASTTGPGLKNGDVVEATISGDTITAYINGVEVLQGTDSTYATGDPGMGFFLQGSANTQDYGFTSFTATSTPAGASVASVVESPSSGDLSTGSSVTLTLDMNEAVTVNTTGGKPTLTLNDGGTATYTGGSGTNALTFSYTVAAGQNTADLAATAVNLNGATIKDGAGNAANLTGAVTKSAGSLQIDTTAPTVSSVVASGTGITPAPATSEPAGWSR